MKVQLPDHALPFFGSNAGFNWEAAEWIEEKTLKGMTFGGVAVFHKPEALVFTSDLDVDIDGPGGSRLTDPCWQPYTSLKTAAGNSVDSRTFPGLVIDNALIQLGARVGDFGFIAWRGAFVAFQVYDTGPADKIGEGSIYLHRRAGLILPNQTDHYAATSGHAVTDVATVIFPNSGPRHALAADLVLVAAQRCLKEFTGAMGA